MTLFLLAASLLAPAVETELLDALSGERAQAHTQVLASGSRYPGSKGFRRAAEYVVEQAAKAGLKNVRVERFPMSEPSWDVVSAELWMIEPERTRLATTEAIELTLAQYSHEADVSAELVDVGPGTSESDYAGREVAGKIVLASGHPRAVQARAMEKKAVGIVSDWQGQFFGVTPSRGAVSWAALDWHKPGFAFVLSPRGGERLRARLARGKIMVQARVDVDAADTTEMEMVMGELPGTAAQGDDVVLSAHLDHHRPGANDNASGSAALLEMARVLAARPPARRTVRFWWTTEILSVHAYFERHPEEARRIAANVNMDQAGGDIRRPTELVYTQSLRWLPTFWDDVLQSFAEDARDRWARPLFEPASRFVAPTGSRFPLWLEFWTDGDPTPGSDNYAFIDAFIGIPSANIAAATLETIHSSDDRPEIIDPTCLKRAMYLAGAPVVWLAGAGPAEVRSALGLVAARARARVEAELAEALPAAAHEPARNRLRQAVLRESARVRSLLPLAAADARLRALIEAEARALEDQRKPLETRLAAYFEAPPSAASATPSIPPASAASTASADLVRLAKRVPQRAVSLGPDAPRWRRFRHQSLPGNAVLYANNLIDGRRSVADIWDALRALLPDTKLEAVEAYVDAMEKAGLVRY